MGSPRSVDGVFIEICRRRRGLIAALTTDVKQFVAVCDPEKDCLLSVNPDDATWEVTFPPPDVPPEHPEPPPGVNFKLEDTPVGEWLLQIALQSDSWLKSVASHHGAQFDSADRHRLLTMVDSLPTVYEAVAKDIRLVLDGGNESKIPDETIGVDVGVHKECGSCSGEKNGEFWIMCDTCEKWYHGNCVQITPSMANNIDKYKCPYCRRRR